MELNYFSMKFKQFKQCSVSNSLDFSIANRKTRRQKRTYRKGIRGVLVFERRRSCGKSVYWRNSTRAAFRQNWGREKNAPIRLLHRNLSNYRQKRGVRLFSGDYPRENRFFRVSPIKLGGFFVRVRCESGTFINCRFNAILSAISYT